VNSVSLFLRLCFFIWSWSRVISSGVIGSGGLGLHPLVIRAVMAFWSGLYVVDLGSFFSNYFDGSESCLLYDVDFH